ncbi:hypothetical protein Tco_0178962 [Tanacetum coccineum]
MSSQPFHPEAENTSGRSTWPSGRSTRLPPDFASLILAPRMIKTILESFETYVKSKDLDLWHIISSGDSPPVVKNITTQPYEEVHYNRQIDDLKNKLAKNNEAKMVLIMLYLDRNTIEFSCVKRLRNLAVLRALHLKWGERSPRLKIDRFSSLALEELIGNLKVHMVIMEKDFEIYKGKKGKVKSIALKAKKESSDDETSSSDSEDEEYAMARMELLRKRIALLKGKEFNCLLKPMNKAKEYV